MKSCRPWRILHVRLDLPARELAHEEGCEGVCAIFWWQDVALGHAWITSDELPFSARQLIDCGLAASLQAVRSHLAGIGSPGGAACAADAPFTGLRDAVEARCVATRNLPATVVICTRDRTDLLARCLDSLLPALGANDDIVVVDNAPRNDATRALVHRYAGVRYVCEPTPGLDAARNRGIRASDGALVVFCDDDVVVEPCWLRRIKAPFVDAKVSAVTGLVLPVSLETEAEYVFEACWGFNRGFEVRVFGPDFLQRHRRDGAPVWNIGAGASMAFRRSVLDQIGGFDERLDAGAAGCSGDSEMWYRILATGHTCHYEPTAVAHHRHRRGMPEFRSQIFHYMRGHAAALLIQFERHHHWGNLKRLLWALPCHYARKLVRHAIGSDRRRTQTLPAEIAGWMAGIGYYLRHAGQRTPSVAREHTSARTCPDSNASAGGRRAASGAVPSASGPLAGHREE